MHSLQKKFKTHSVHVGWFFSFDFSSVLHYGLQMWQSVPNLYSKCQMYINLIWWNKQNYEVYQLKGWEHCLIDFQATYSCIFPFRFLNLFFSTHDLQINCRTLPCIDFCWFLHHFWKLNKSTCTAVCVVLLVRIFLWFKSVSTSFINIFFLQKKLWGNTQLFCFFFLFFFFN